MKFFPLPLSFLFGLLLISCSNKGSKKYQNVTSARMDYVSVSILTPFSIPCGDFETMFKSSIHTLVFSEKRDVDAFIDYQNDFLPDTQVNNVDTRMKITLFENDKKVSTICLDQFGTFTSGNSNFYKNDGYFEFLKKKIEGAQRKE